MNEEFTLQLKPRQHEYLAAVAQKYRLPDASKALRCLIDFAQDRPELEAAIFEEIRCLDC